MKATATVESCYKSM